MSTDTAVEESIEAAAQAVGPVWPLHSFVTANPLAGFEHLPFHEAVATGERLFGGDGYPSAMVFRRAWEADRIDPELLRAHLRANGSDPDPEASLDRMAATDRPATTDRTTTATDRVDAVVTKWLAAFLDQGQADWAMPNRGQGFYEAVRTVAPYDDDLPDGGAFADLPATPAGAIREHLADIPVGEWQDVFEFHLTALPGWTGLLRQRATSDDAWQSASPATLTDYLAVRLTLAALLDAPLAPCDGPGDDARVDGTDDDHLPLPEIWLTAWEATYRSSLVEPLVEASATTATASDGGRPAAQLVFCIDTRSEIVRRHVEAAGDYETDGYAGFFGIPMSYGRYDSEVAVDACPPILDAQHRITDRPTRPHDERRTEHDRWRATLDGTTAALGSLKSNAATAFSFVESAGPGYGAALLARTLLPARVYDLLDAADRQVPATHEFCAPSVDYNPDAVYEFREGLTLAEKVEYAATAFELLGWERFARLVAFVGHAGRTANNPFESSLDCGACAGNPGGPNARVLAAICNDDAVRTALRERDIDVPDDTVFVAGEHNTTTDEVELYAGDVPESHAGDVEALRDDLAVARAGAAAERADDMGVEGGDGVRETERRAADWAETRPEWGLAGNAAFVVGPRALTEEISLDGRSFLHSYDWRTDPEGTALETILTGPMVVTQWINTQYYFATVDNAVYGSGSKVTHNPVGNVGVYQGNGGDLTTGLPLQSLTSGDDDPYHQPLRLSTVVHAPVERVTAVLADNDHLAELLDNGWLSLTVVDPEQDHRAVHYDGDLEWVSFVDPPSAGIVPARSPPVDDD